ncbi:PAS domain-containing protein [Streptomyces sp. ODS28]|uniref:PAS domain-containing protein n=1 Tax=Streptomyces sp. ODS28 TaxID=3136688 RepID=UPI0031EA4EF8
MSSRPSRGAARLAAILDALPDALLLVNCNGTVVNANTIALETFEAPGTALVGRGLLDLLPEFDSKRIPGSMRRPDEDEQIQGRQKPTRMVARRTDGNQFPVEVTSANLEDGRTPYASAFEAAFSDHGLGHGNTYTGDELLMLVVRDLTGTLDTEAELARQQRQTEMILRAASEGVVGVDTQGRIVLVNPAAAQILGYRAGDLGGQELHPLVHHSRPDGTPLPYEETPLANTLKSGRKHRVKVGQVLWAKNGRSVPVDMTTAPVRDGEQLVGAVLTFADRRPYEALAGRHEQLLAVLDDALRRPLDQLRDELAGLAADPAGNLWPEANQILHHLAAGYARMTTLVDNVLGYQRLDAGREKLRRVTTPLDAVVASGVEGAVELIGPGRAQFAVHAPPIEAEVDAERLSTALAHLIADVAGVDATGNAPVAAPAGVDPTIVVAAAKRGEVVRIEVRGPYGGGSPVHEPIVRGIVQRHGGVLQTHEVPGNAGGSAYVLEVPVAASGAAQAAGAKGAGQGTAGGDATSGDGTQGGGTQGGGTQARNEGAQPDATQGGVRGGADGTDGAGAEVPAGGTGGAVGPMPGEAPGEVPAGAAEGGAEGELPRQREGETTVMPVPGRPVRGTEARHAAGGEAHGVDGVDGAWGSGASPDGGAEQPEMTQPETMQPEAEQTGAGQPTGRRRGRPSPAEEQHEQAAPGDTGARSSALALPSAEGAEAGAVPGAGVDQATMPVPSQGSGRRARRALAAPDEERQDGGTPAPGTEVPDGGQNPPPGSRRARRLARERAEAEAAQQAQQEPGAAQQGEEAQAAEGQQGATGPAFAMPGRMEPVPPQPVPPQQEPQQEPQQPAGPQSAGPQAAAQEGGEAAAPAGPFALPPAPEPAGPAPDAAPGQPVPPQPMPYEARQALSDGAAAAGAYEGRELEPATAGAQMTRQQDAQAAQQWPEAPAPARPEPRGDQPQPVQQPEQAPATQTQQPQAEQAQPEQDGQEQAPAPARSEHSRVAASPILGGGPLPEQHGRQELPAPAEESGPGPRVRTLGQGVPFAQRLDQAGQQGPTGQTGRHGTVQPQGQAQAGLPAPAPAAAIPSTPSTPPQPGSGRRRKLATPPDEEAPQAQQQEQAQAPGGGSAVAPRQPQQGAGPMPQPQPQPGTEGGAREFSIGAPEAGAGEGPEPLDGPDSPVEVSDGRGLQLAQGVDDELPPEPLDNPRRLLVWPEPDNSTQQALSDRGYRPVIVNSREEVDAQIAAYPAALFVDPLTGPITRTALQSLRTAAVAAEVPVLVTAGLGQATREAAYGADPAVLLKALAPRDSEQHPPRVLLVEEHQAIAGALTQSLERRGMQVAHAPTDAEAVNAASQIRPNLVVMDLMQVRRRRAGIIDWLRVNGQLNRTPFVVYTSADMDQDELPRLASGETVLFLAERSTSADVQSRIVDLLTKIGAS